MSFETCILPGAVIVRPKVFPDNRGYFKEVSRRDTYAANGIDRDFVQINMSHSRHGVLRGLHYQLKFPQAKLVSVAYGAIYDVIIDCRKSSPAFGKWIGVKLTAEGGEELFVPEGFAHGFTVLSDSAELLYKTTEFWYPEHDRSLAWDDPAIGIDWAKVGCSVRVRAL